MRNLTLSKLLLAIVSLLFVVTAQADEMVLKDHPLVGKLWDMNSRSFINEDELITRIIASDVLMLGEVHDNVEHHELQQKLFKARIESGRQPALMMEQLDAQSQPILDQALAGEDRDKVLNNVTALIKFSDTQFYTPLLSIAIDNHLPVIAANVPNHLLRPVIWDGYEAYDADELMRLMVEDVWNESRQKYLARNMGGAHCGQLREELRVGLTRSQRLRDALMTDSAIASVDRGVVAIVGSSHARYDIGLPLYFAARAPTSLILSIAFVEVTENANDPSVYNRVSATGEAPYDVMWFTPRMDREDPCANFDKSKLVMPPGMKVDSKVSPHVQKK